MRILIIEDDKKLAAFIHKGLSAEKYLCQVCYNGLSGLAQAMKDKYELILLDLMLPDVTGIEVLSQLRQNNIDIPVLVLTARDEMDMKREAFTSGADDYLTKPFHYEELLLRVRALIKRGRSNTSANVLKVADMELNLHSHKVTRSGQEVELSAKEFGLLEYLMRNEGRVLSRAMIFDNVWAIGFETDTNLVDVYIMYLRKKIDQGFEPKLIHTVRGMGYVLKDRSQ